jgi:hypothetical protein
MNRPNGFPNREAASEQDPVDHDPDHDNSHHKSKNQLIPVEMFQRHGPKRIPQSVSSRPKAA